MISRRDWLAMVPAIAMAARAGAAEARFEFLTESQAQDVEAMAAQIIPSDPESPGAKEAGVVYFIDRALSRFFPEQQALYKKGLAEVAGFAALSPASQIEKLRSIEKGEFFEAVRTHTVMGFLADPSYGGNRNQAGWKLIGFTPAHVYRPPFGAYDGEKE